MYGFHPSAKWVCAASAVLILAAFAAGTAWGQRDAGLAAQALANWLESEDGDHDELQAVTQHGQAIVPSLIAALNEGPSPATHDELGRALAERYEQLVEQSKKNPHAPIAVTRDRFVELYGGALDTQHRIRAAQALAAIGGERALAALEAAASQAPRDDVRAAVTTLLMGIKGR
jgi:hypothetical protein